MKNRARAAAPAQRKNLPSALVMGAAALASGYLSSAVVQSSASQLETKAPTIAPYPERHEAVRVSPELRTLHDARPADEVEGSASPHHTSVQQRIEYSSKTRELTLTAAGARSLLELAEDDLVVSICDYLQIAHPEGSALYRLGESRISRSLDLSQLEDVWTLLKDIPVAMSDEQISEAARIEPHYRATRRAALKKHNAFAVAATPLESLSFTTATQSKEAREGVIGRWAAADMDKFEEMREFIAARNIRNRELVELLGRAELIEALGEAEFIEYFSSRSLVGESYAIQQ